MTSPDELQNAWQDQNAKIAEVTLTLDKLLRRQDSRRVETPMRRLIFALRVEIGLAASALVVLGGFVADHWSQFRFVWPALTIDLWLLAVLIASIRQLVQARIVNYDGSVLQAQQQLTYLRTLRLHTFRWAILTGQIVWWLPFAIVACKLILGADLYRFFTPVFILTNLLGGVALIPLAVCLSRHMKAASPGAMFERIGDLIAGRSLAEARRQAATLADFG